MREENKDLSFGATLGNASFEACDERPQFVHGVRDSPSLAGDLRESDGRVGELDHGRKVSVVVLGDPEDVAGDRELPGDVCQRSTVTRLAEPPLQEADIR